MLSVDVLSLFFQTEFVMEKQVVWNHFLLNRMSSMMWTQFFLESAMMKTEWDFYICLVSIMMFSTTWWNTRSLDIHISFHYTISFITFHFFVSQNIHFLQHFTNTFYFLYSFRVITFTLSPKEIVNYGWGTSFPMMTSILRFSPPFCLNVQ